MDVFLMTSDVARRLGKSAEAVRYYEKTGRLHAEKTSNGRRLFKESDVKKLAEELTRADPDGAPILPPAAYKMTKRYNQRCYDLALFFLEDKVSELMLVEKLAQEIQDTIEMFLQSEGL